ncbi:MAG: DEAD/DEAH box helicase family protein, partial [Verrucomicrobia bacterium]|nr:DEAD/DEAH box helicase family protein [Verrucomicrobiota bacterium]
MENPFNRPPIDVSARQVDGRVPCWRKDYLAAVSATKDEKGRLLESLRTGEDPTIRDGVNLALSRLLDPEAPRDPMGKTAFLVHDGTGTGKSFQAILAAKAIAAETGEPAFLTTRADLIPALRRDLDRLGLDDSGITFVAIEQLGPFLKDVQKQQRQFSVAIVDEAQDCRIPEVRKLLDRIPASRQLFFSATPFNNIDEFCYFSSKLTGKPIHQIKTEI